MGGLTLRCSGQRLRRVVTVRYCSQGFGLATVPDYHRRTDEV